MDNADMVANAKRPVVQESSDYAHHVELILPGIEETVVMDEAVAACVCADIMRVVSGISHGDEH